MFGGKIKKSTLLKMAVALIVIFGLYFFIFKVTNLKDKFAEARNVQRSIEVQSISDAVYMYIANSGRPLSSIGTISNCNTSRTKIGTTASQTAGEWVDVSTSLKGEYLPEIPKDPSNGTDQDTGYSLCLLPNDRIEVDAPRAELGKTIAVRR